MLNADDMQRLIAAKWLNRKTAATISNALCPYAGPGQQRTDWQQGFYGRLDIYLLNPASTNQTRGRKTFEDSDECLQGWDTCDRCLTPAVEPEPQQRITEIINWLSLACGELCDAQRPNADLYDAIDILAKFTDGRVLSHPVGMGKNRELYLNQYALPGSSEEGIEDPKGYYRVEYDPNYHGGDYSGTGDFFYIPVSLFDRIKPLFEDEDKAVHAYVLSVEMLDVENIVHYTLDEVYNLEGELKEE